MGPQGRTGDTGPTGATGPACKPYNASLMVHSDAELFVPVASPIKFNITNLSNGITYDPTTGEITVPSDGLYLILWWLNVKNKDKGEECVEVPLGVDLKQTSPAFFTIASSATHNKTNCCDTGTINGNAIFSATANSKYQLFNASIVDFQLIVNNVYSASVSITRIN